ncbi:MAG TPA: hypothetical protein DCO77_12835 [Nitrospiraceae bacterium]|nr:hypothetical protein [Nitrospiraceae bacterium]
MEFKALIAKRGHTSMNITSLIALRNNQKGIALVTALVVVLVVFLMIMSTLYIATISTKISGAGKRYATAQDAGDGSIEVIKDAIDKLWYNDSLPDLFTDGTIKPPYPDCTGSGESSHLFNAIENIGNPCTMTMTLPGTVGGNYTAKVTVEFVFRAGLPGSRIEFPPRFTAGKSNTAMFYRITTIVTGPDNTTAENAVLYRYTG